MYNEFRRQELEGVSSFLPCGLREACEKPFTHWAISPVQGFIFPHINAQSFTVSNVKCSLWTTFLDNKNQGKMNNSQGRREPLNSSPGMTRISQLITVLWHRWLCPTLSQSDRMVHIPVTQQRGWGKLVENKISLCNKTISIKQQNLHRRLGRWPNW